MDKTAQAFWSGCERGELGLQRCDDCGALQRYPRPFCAQCGASTLSTIVAAGTGTIYTLTEVIRAPTPEFEALVPYSIALVDLDEGTRVMAHAAPGLIIDDRVRLRFRKHGEHSLPYFEKL